jgi:hypothetical protein
MGLADAETSVYRLYDGEDRLLYVGIAVEPFLRLDKHWKTKAWWSSVTHVVIEWFPSRQDALDEELRVIRTDAPMHNIQGRGGPGQCRPTPPRPAPIRGAERLAWIGA